MMKMKTNDEAAELREQARKRGLISGAIHRGEIPPLGALVRWSTKGRPGTGRFKVDEHRMLADGRFPDAHHLDPAGLGAGTPHRVPLLGDGGADHRGRGRMTGGGGGDGAWYLLREGH